MEHYKLTKQQTFEDVSSNSVGLSKEEALLRLQKYGKNELAEENERSPFIIFLSQYKDFLVIILIIAAIISMILKDVESSIVILVVITINAILGTIQELKAEASLKGLKAMSAPTAKVVRDGKIVVINGNEVVVGDVVVVEAGDYICADGRIIENAGLKSDESALTGESVPVEKEDTQINEEKPLGDLFEYDK